MNYQKVKQSGKCISALFFVLCLLLVASDQDGFRAEHFGHLRQDGAAAHGGEQIGKHADGGVGLQLLPVFRHRKPLYAAKSDLPVGTWG